MERLDQGHLHPKLEVPGLRCPDRESNLETPRSEASTLEKSDSNSLLIAILNICKWAHDMALPSACVTGTYMNTLTALGCRPNSTCKADGLLPSRHLASPRVSNHIGVTTMERLEQCHLYPKLEVPGLTCPGWESNLGLHGGRRAL